MSGFAFNAKRYDFKPSNATFYRAVTNGLGSKGEVFGRDDTDFFQYFGDGATPNTPSTDIYSEFNLNKEKKVGGEIQNQRHGNGTDEFGFVGRFVGSYDQGFRKAFYDEYNPAAYPTLISVEADLAYAYSFGYEVSNKSRNIDSNRTRTLTESFDRAFETAQTKPVNWLVETPIYVYGTTISGYGPNTSPYDWDKDELGDAYWGTVYHDNFKFNGNTLFLRRPDPDISKDPTDRTVYPYATGYASHGINLNDAKEYTHGFRNLTSSGDGTGYYKDVNSIWKSFNHKPATLAIPVSPKNGVNPRGHAHERPPKFSVIMRILLGGSEGHQFTDAELDETLPNIGGYSEPTQFNTLRKIINYLTKLGWEIELNVERNDTINGLVGPNADSSKRFTCQVDLNVPGTVGSATDSTLTFTNELNVGGSTAPYLGRLLFGSNTQISLRGTYRARTNVYPGSILDFSSVGHVWSRDEDGQFPTFMFWKRSQSSYRSIAYSNAASSAYVGVPEIPLNAWVCSVIRNGALYDLVLRDQRIAGQQSVMDANEFPTIGSVIAACTQPDRTHDFERIEISNNQLYRDRLFSDCIGINPTFTSFEAGGVAGVSISETFEYEYKPNNNCWVQINNNPKPDQNTSQTNRLNHVHNRDLVLKNLAEDHEDGLSFFYQKDGLENPLHNYGGSTIVPYVPPGDEFNPQNGVNEIGSWTFNFKGRQISSSRASRYPWDGLYQITAPSSFVQVNGVITLTFSDTSNKSTLYNTTDHTSPGGDGVIPDVFAELEKASLENLRFHQFKSTTHPLPDLLVDNRSYGGSRNIFTSEFGTMQYSLGASIFEPGGITAYTPYSTYPQMVDNTKNGVKPDLLPNNPGTTNISLWQNNGYVLGGLPDTQVPGLPINHRANMSSGMRILNYC